MKDIAKWVTYTGIFAIPFIPLIITSSFYFPFVTGKNFTFRIIVEIIFAAWLILALYEPRYRPKFSWILIGLLSLVGVMFFANLFGEFPAKSFWSNFERMEGYVTLVHLFMYVLVAGTALNSTKLWCRFFNVSLWVAVFVSFYALAQLAGMADILQSSWRLDGTLGNAAYMAIYMLFHIFIAAYMFTQTTSSRMRYVYGGLITFFLVLLIQTGTRGTALGLIVGSTVSALYFALFTKGHAMLRKAAVATLLVVIVTVGLLATFRDSAFIENNQYLGRITDISLEQATTRFQLWGIAFEGVKDRPLLGWGQENYNYVFNTYYDPSLYGQEPWFDRVHNIVLDWLIAGGVFGLVAYLFVLFAAVYYIFIRPLLREDNAFTSMERGILLGLLAGYTFHNLFVFDNIVSYIFYGSILALIHSRVSHEVVYIEKQHITRSHIDNALAPAVALTLIVVLYVVNVPGMQAANNLVAGMKTQSPQDAIALFEQVAQGSSIGVQEGHEQLALHAQKFLQTPDIPHAVKEEAFLTAEREMQEFVAENPGDARMHIFFGALYRAAGLYDKALEQYSVAQDFSPKKQQIMFDKGLVYLTKGEYETAYEYFKEAYELDTAFPTAAGWYAIGGLYTGQPEIVSEVITDDTFMQAFALNTPSPPAAYYAKEYELLKEILKIRIEESPGDNTLRVNLALVNHEAGDTDEAIVVLEQAIRDIPAFKLQGESLIAKLRAGTLE